MTGAEEADADETQRQSISRRTREREPVWQGPLDDYGSLMHS